MRWWARTEKPKCAMFPLLFLCAKEISLLSGAAPSPPQLLPSFNVEERFPPLRTTPVYKAVRCSTILVTAPNEYTLRFTLPTAQAPSLGVHSVVVDIHQLTPDVWPSRFHYDTQHRKRGASNWYMYFYTMAVYHVSYLIACPPCSPLPSVSQRWQLVTPANCV